MTAEAKQLYLKKVSLRYKKATKKQKSRYLSEAEEICDYSRKYLIRILGAREVPQTQKRGRKPKYTIDDGFHLVRLWKLMRYMCSKRMVAALPLWLNYYDCPEEVKKHLLEMSPATMDRLLKFSRTSWRKGKSSTKSGAFIKSMIPLELLTERAPKPGFVEADTVVHCGNTMLGKYANTLTITDLFSGWTENRATWTKDSDAVLAKVSEIRGAMPFIMLGFATDNGTEFINYKMVNYMKNKKNGVVKFIRRRPYRKNDNAHVEQKNNTHVRQLFGYSRLDSRELIELMNDIYKNYWGVFNNFFCPVMKLEKKVRIGGRIKKIYDKPKTPYQRLIDSGFLTELQENNLKITMQGLNPIELHKSLEKKMSLFNACLTKDQIMGGNEETKEQA